eukprot:869209-Prorocentrum_minimum.AAC.1
MPRRAILYIFYVSFRIERFQNLRNVDVPDWSTAKVLPWRKSHAAVQADMRLPGGEGGGAWGLCPRECLRRQVAALAAAHDGLELRVGFESEFVLMRMSADGTGDPARAVEGLNWEPLRNRNAQSASFTGMGPGAVEPGDHHRLVVISQIQPAQLCNRLPTLMPGVLDGLAVRSVPRAPQALEQSLYGQTSAVHAAADVLEEIYDTLAQMGIQVEQMHAESAPGQFEVVTAHKPALEAADQLLYTREAICAVAADHGCARKPATPDRPVDQ